MVPLEQNYLVTQGIYCFTQSSNHFDNFKETQHLGKTALQLLKTNAQRMCLSAVGSAATPLVTGKKRITLVTTVLTGHKFSPNWKKELSPCSGRRAVPSKLCLNGLEGLDAP